MNSELSQAETYTEVRTVSSPVLQLLYAHYFLTRPVGGRAGIVPDWKLRLEQREPALVQALQQQFRPGERRYFFMMLACELGYWNDPNPRRFLRDLPLLPAQLPRHLAEHPNRDWDEELQKRTHQLAENPATWSDLMNRLNEALVTEWQETGRHTVDEHRRQFDSTYAETGDIIKALPPYHFIRFEKTAASIRTVEGKQEIVVVPLYFAAAGGFSFSGGGRQFVGFGLRSEHVFDDIRNRVDREARKIKALSDPTRLLLLTLIARYSGFSLTVGDLAQYLGVSQPTVSGHLKILRESGLVEVERQGNRSFYRPDTAAIQVLLSDLGETLLPH